MDQGGSGESRRLCLFLPARPLCTNRCFARVAAVWRTVSGTHEHVLRLQRGWRLDGCLGSLRRSLGHTLPDALRPSRPLPPQKKHVSGSEPADPASSGCTAGPRPPRRPAEPGAAGSHGSTPAKTSACKVARAQATRDCHPLGAARLQHQARLGARQKVCARPRSPHAVGEQSPARLASRKSAGQTRPAKFISPSFDTKVALEPREGARRPPKH